MDARRPDPRTGRRRGRAVIYLLDTDVVSIWQNGTGADYAVLALRMSAHPVAYVGVSVVSFHEQMIGANAYLSRGKATADAVGGYERMERLRRWFAALDLVPYDAPAGAIFDRLKTAKVRVGTMD